MSPSKTAGGPSRPLIDEPAQMVSRKSEFSNAFPLVRERGDSGF
jgi:hypothetical protein